MPRTAPLHPFTVLALAAAVTATTMAAGRWWLSCAVLLGCLLLAAWARRARKLAGLAAAILLPAWGSQLLIHGMVDTAGSHVLAAAGPLRITAEGLATASAAGAAHRGPGGRRAAVHAAHRPARPGRRGRPLARPAAAGLPAGGHPVPDSPDGRAPACHRRGAGAARRRHRFRDPGLVAARHPARGAAGALLPAGRGRPFGPPCGTRLPRRRAAHPLCVPCRIRPPSDGCAGLPWRASCWARWPSWPRPGRRLA